MKDSDIEISSSYYYKSYKFQDNSTGSDIFLESSVSRRITSQHGSSSFLISNNKVSSNVLNNNFMKYANLVDNKNGVNNYAEGVQGLAKFVKTAQCQKWKSGLLEGNESEIKTCLPPVLCNSSDCLNSFISSNGSETKDSEDIIQLLLDAYDDNKVDYASQLKEQNENTSGCISKRKHTYNSIDVTETIKNRKMDKQVNWDGSQFIPPTVEQKTQTVDKPKARASVLQFKTASAELKAQNNKKYGGSHNTNNSNVSHDNAYQQQKRSLGSRPRPVTSKFVLPTKPNNNDRMPHENENNESEQFSQENVDPRLQHIEGKMIEMIRSEVKDCTNPITWDDIAGLHFAKSTIQEIVVWPMLRPDIFTGLRRPPKGILLFGPPGTGKTLIAKCIASQSKCTFFSISASSLTSKWIGDGEKMVRALFAVARVDQPSVVFIDEIDSLLSRRSDTEHESSRRIKTEFLVQLDGATTDDEDRLLIIGATNRPHELDEAARRRLVKRLYIPLPENEARVEMVTRLMAKERNDLTAEDIKWIGDVTDGYSGADVKILCQEAALGPIRSISFTQIEHISSEQVRPVSLDDFKNALNRVKSSVSQDDLNCYITWDKTYGSGSV